MLPAETSTKRSHLPLWYMLSSNDAELDVDFPSYDVPSVTAIHCIDAPHSLSLIDSIFNYRSIEIRICCMTVLNNLHGSQVLFYDYRTSMSISYIRQISISISPAIPVPWSLWSVVSGTLIALFILSLGRAGASSLWALLTPESNKPILVLSLSSANWISPSISSLHSATFASDFYLSNRWLDG